MDKQSTWFDEDDLHGPGPSREHAVVNWLWALDGSHRCRVPKVDESWGGPLWPKEGAGSSVPLSALGDVPGPR